MRYLIFDTKVTRICYTACLMTSVSHISSRHIGIINIIW